MGVEITAELAIPDDELELTAARSSGPGGQHVNKTSTRVILRFDVLRSPSLDDAQRRRILARLATRISREGVLRLSSQSSRSREANRRAAIERFAELLRGALAEAAPRTATRPSRAAKERRIQEKKVRGRIKRDRRSEE